jgi:hypothetical protein
VPTDTQRWLKNSAGLEPDLFQYLVNVEKAPTTSRISSNYGSQSWAGRNVNLTTVLGNMYLVDNDAVFLRSLRASHSNIAINNSIVEAVQRQEAFVDKMHAQLWIRSPALEGTLRRAINRYLKFLKLFTLYPTTMLVPTLDIDLVWHTHQCSAALYRSAMLERVGRFVNHDDKLGQSVLDGAMEKTRQLFRMRFVEEYLLCHCWDCEATLSAVEEAENRKDQGQDPKDMKTVAQNVLMDVVYYRSVELARRAGKPFPLYGR